MSVSLTSLTGLFGGASGSGVSLLQTLYGFAGQTANASGVSPSTALLNAEKRETQEVKATAAQPEVKLAVDAFKKGVAQAKTVDQLLSNPAVMRVLLTANGLGDQVNYAALAKKALTSDLSDAKSLANTLTDTRWKTTAQTYGFAAKGLSVIRTPAVIDAVANAYAEVTWRKSLDAQTPGLSNALTFRAEAAKFTNVDQILGDNVMRDVVTTALGVPKEIAFQPLNAQEKAITTRLDIRQFQDPKFVEKFAQRYLVAANTAGAGGAADLLSLSVQSRGLLV